MLLQWSCDWCGTLLAPPPRGRFRCPGCRYVHRVPFGGPAGAAGVSAVPRGALEPVPGSHCAAHPDATAVGACERCGDFACQPCSRVIQGRLYCIPCVALQTERGEVGGRVRWAASDARSALVLAGFSLFFPPCSIILSVPAAWLAVTALRSGQGKGPSSHRWRAYAALGIASLSLLLSILIWGMVFKGF